MDPNRYQTRHGSQDPPVPLRPNRGHRPQQQLPTDSSSQSPSSPSPSLGSSSSEGPDLRSGGSSGHGRNGAGTAVVGTSGGEQELVPLLGGERVEASYPQMTYLCPYSTPSALKGTLTVSNYRLYFRAQSKDGPVILDVPLGFITRIEKVGGQRTSNAENAYGLEIYCKDIRNLRFALSKVDSQRKDIYETVRKPIRFVEFPGLTSFL